MTITNDLSITKKSLASGNTYFFTVKSTHKVLEVSLNSSHSNLFEITEYIYDKLRVSSCDTRESKFIAYSMATINEPLFETLKVELGYSIANSNTENTDTAQEETSEQKLLRGLDNILHFFKDFQFTPSFRFINTLSKILSAPIGGRDMAKSYVANYFSLMDNSYKSDVLEKMKCAEFDNILTDIRAVAPTKTVNNRFKLYYGTQGTGKTTIAMAETDNRCIVCNSSMLPADLMEDFVFVDGKATFKPSSLWNCMTEGKTIVLDEINLLPFDSLRFLQGILDGKTSFEYKGNTVTVADGFQIIGTMNLTVNGMTFGLPEPLVDRCAEIKEFTLTADMLKGAIV